MGELEKSGAKLQRLTEERETAFGLSYREVRKIEGLRDRDSTVLLVLVAAKTVLFGQTQT